MRAFRIGKDERGISTVIVAISLIGVFGATMLSLDAGNMWQTRRKIVTATDATALQQAMYLATSAPPDTISCEATWTDTLVTYGEAGTTPKDCVFGPGSTAGGTGWVGVDGNKLAETRFGSLLGIGDTNPYSFSAAQWGFVSEGKGLRPIGFCNQNAHVQTWVDLKNGPPGITQAQYDDLRGDGDVNGDSKIDYPADIPANWGVVHRMYFNKSVDDGQCGTFPGNWGWLCFTGDCNTNVLNPMIENGYPEPVPIREDDDPDCAGAPGGGDADDTAEGCVPGDPGALANQNASAMDKILHKPITIMIFDAGDCGGGGSNCEFDAWAFLGVTLRRYQATGEPENRYFDFEFTDLILSGTCCLGSAPNGVDTGIRGVKICGVDHDTSGLSQAQRCAL